MQSQKPASLIPKSVAAPGLLSHILISKYENHLPLYRQEQMFARSGVLLTRDVLVKWFIASGKSIIPLKNLLKDEQVASASLQSDETPYRVLTIDGVNVSKKSYIWVTCKWGPKSIVLYHHARGRGSKYIKEILTDFKGFLQVDAYSGYDWVDSAMSGIVRIGCMAHVRRQFTDFLKTMPKPARDGHPASRIVTLMKPLYAIEDRLRENPSLDRMQIRVLFRLCALSSLEEVAR
jgi:transposase